MLVGVRSVMCGVIDEDARKLKMMMMGRRWEYLPMTGMVGWKRLVHSG
jgi:hypothetical protein